MVLLTNYSLFGAIMAILFLEELRLSGSLGRHAGVTRRSFSRETKINEVVTGLRNFKKCDSRI